MFIEIVLFNEMNSIHYTRLPKQYLEIWEEAITHTSMDI